MQVNEENIRIIFGLKLKQLRTERKLSLAELSKASGLSISYLNEIEKWKKYPKTDKIVALSSALGVPYDRMVSLKLTKNLAPLAELFNSKFLKELPLEMFGIDSNKLIEIIANAPAKVNAFISTLIEIARNYDLSQEEFYLATLRSYQESHENYFEDIEDQVSLFASEFGINQQKRITRDMLQKILEDRFNYVINDTELHEFPELEHLRGVLIPGEKNMFLINNTMTDSQRAFLFGRELGYVYQGLRDRAYVSYMLKADTFDKVLNNFKASYFSSSLLIPRERLIRDVKKLIVTKRWDGQQLLKIMYRYTRSPEMFMHRLTNILPRFFGLSNLFFLRFESTHNTNYYTLTKELHLSQLHNPHGNELEEHYCRRWISLKVLKELEEKRLNKDVNDHVIGAQISKYHDSSNEYFIISIARPKMRSPDANCSVSIGFLLNSELKKNLNFWNDPAVPHQIVSETCERCPIAGCEERAVPPVIADRKDQTAQVMAALEQLTERMKGK